MTLLSPTDRKALAREPVEATPRRAMTLARKRRIHAAWRGKCADCGAPVPLTGPGVIYDHRVPIWFGSPDEDSEVRPLCAPCDAVKTPADQSRIAKTKRQMELNEPPKPPKRPIRSAGFNKSKSKGIDGVVRDRAPVIRQFASTAKTRG